MTTTLGLYLDTFLLLLQLPPVLMAVHFVAFWWMWNATLPRLFSAPRLGFSDALVLFVMVKVLGY